MSKLDAMSNPCAKHANFIVTGTACVSCMVDRIAELEAEVEHKDKILEINANKKTSVRDMAAACNKITGVENNISIGDKALSNGGKLKNETDSEFEPATNNTSLGYKTLLYDGKSAEAKEKEGE